MFTAKIIGFCFVSMLISTWLHDVFLKKDQLQLSKATVYFGFIASLYCVIAGIFLLSGWQDPLAGADPSEVAKASVRHRKGGLVILLIKYFPYVLIGAGGFFAYMNFSILRLTENQLKAFQTEMKK